jgi:putative aminopeptidase FrvX
VREGDGMRELLRELVLADAPSGREQEVQKIVLRELEPLVDDLHVDIMGNVIAQVNGATDKRFMLIAHQDEDWALLVTHIDDQGYLRFTRLVGHRWNLLGQRVNIHGAKGKLTGVVGLPAPHLIPVKEQQKGYRPEFDRMFIDCGAQSAEDAQSMGFEIGQYVTAEKHFKELANGRLLGNCFDNRVGLVAMIEVLRRIHQTKVDMNVVVVASVQEELGTRGARPAAFSVEPDYAVALDVSPTGDHPNIKEGLVPVRVGEGPVLLVADQYHVTSHLLNTWIQEVANTHQLPLQGVALRSPVHFGTDAAAVELSKSGSRATALLVPTRYFHTTNSLIQYSDLEESVQLLVKCLESLDQLGKSQ